MNSLGKKNSCGTPDIIGQYLSMKNINEGNTPESINDNGIEGLNHLYKKLSFQEEGTYNEKGVLGEKGYNEILSRFGNTPIAEVLSILKIKGKTFELFTRVANYAFDESFKRDEKFSINAYLYDLSHEKFTSFIDALSAKYENKLNKNIVVEILEPNEGVFDSTVVSNLKFLKEKGFKLAIDDYDPREGEGNMSGKNLKTMLDARIYPDYLKIDGKLFHEILADKVSAKDLRVFFSTIQEMKREGVAIICEWISTLQEGIQARNLGANYFQGRDLDPDTFNLDEAEVTSFSLTKNKNVRSFSLVKTFEIANDNKDKVKSFSLYDEGQVSSFSLATKLKAANDHSEDNTPRGPAGGSSFQKTVKNVIDIVSKDVNQVISQAA